MNYWQQPPAYYHYDYDDSGALTDQEKHSLHKYHLAADLGITQEAVTVQVVRTYDKRRVRELLRTRRFLAKTGTLKLAIDDLRQQQATLHSTPGVGWIDILGQENAEPLQRLNQLVYAKGILDRVGFTAPDDVEGERRITGRALSILLRQHLVGLSRGHRGNLAMTFKNPCWPVDLSNQSELLVHANAILRRAIGLEIKEDVALPDSFALVDAYKHVLGGQGQPPNPWPMSHPAR